MAATAESNSLRAAAPSWADHVAAFGAEGLERRADGTIKGYRYPRQSDPEKRRRQNQKVHELWEPHRRKSIELGANRNGALPTARVRDRETGQILVLPEREAQRRAERGLVIGAPKRRANKMYRGGKWYRYVGGGRWEEYQPETGGIRECAKAGRGPAGHVH